MLTTESHRETSVPVSYTHLIVEYSRPIIFGEDRLRESGSLPAKVYFINGILFSIANDNSRKFKQLSLIPIFSHLG